MMWPLSRFRIDDNSMSPALSPGDYVLVNRWAYAFRLPSVGDVVVLRPPTSRDRFLVKRVARITDSGGVFVLGDNAERSQDSRHFGPVSRHHIVGKVWGHVTP